MRTARSLLVVVAIASTIGIANAEDSIGCPITKLTTQTPDGIVNGFYESGYSWGNDSGCYDPWQVVEVQINVKGADYGRTGMMYVAAFDGDMDGAILRPDGQWEPYRGGIHDPTAGFEQLPGQLRFTIVNSRPQSFQSWRPVSGARAAKPATICDLMRAFGKDEMELGGGYGALQDDALQSIERIEAVPGQPFDTTHLRASHAFSDGMTNEKYGVVFNFACNCGIHPLETGASCSDEIHN